MFGRPTSTARTASSGSLREAICREDGRHAALGLGKLPVQLLARDEGQVFVGEIEARFDVGQQVEQVVAQAVQRASQSAGQLAQGDVQLLRIGGVDHAQDGLGLASGRSVRPERPAR